MMTAGQQVGLPAGLPASIAREFLGFLLVSEHRAEDVGDVLVPRAFGVGAEQRLPPAVDSSGETVKRLKAWILAEYRRASGATYVARGWTRLS